MKLNLLTVTSLLCGLFLFGSCAKDEPQGNTKKEQTVAGGPLVSIDLDMDVAVAEFNEPEAKAQEGRAFTTPQTPVTVKDGAKEELDDNLDPISGKQQKILSVLRDKFIENNQTIDVVMHFECGTKMANVATKMSYDNSIKRYKHGLGENNRNINVPQEILTEMGKGKNAKVTIYTGGSSYDEANERFTVDPVMKEVNLSSLASTPINIPVLYVSTGTELKVENGKLVSASTELDKLKPQGSLLLVTFRNNMDQNVTFDGITAVSNNYFGPNDQSKKSFLKVKGQHNPATELTTEAPSYTSPYNTAVDGGKAYTYFYKGFTETTGATVTSASYTVAKGGAIADKAIIFWGIKGDATTVAPPSASALGDNGYLLNPATGLIHVYAKNAKQGGANIDYPNYNVAPIGGAYFYPESGKAYTLNCEFYTQPRQALGYLDKGYLYKDGTWKHHEFDGTKGSNNPNTYNTEKMRQVPLVNSAEVKEVLDGNVTTSKGAMRVMDQAWLNLTSLLYPLEFKTDMSSSRFKDITLGKGAKGYDLRAHIYSELLPYKATNDDTSEFTNESFIAADYVQKNQEISTANNKYVFGYRQLYIAPRKGSASARPGAHPRSKYQVIVRYLSRAEQGKGDNANNVYVGPIVIESVYLGKYFFGNMMTTPIYLSGNAASPFVYGQESAVYSTAGRVSRVLLNANVMSSLTKDDILKPYSVMKDKAENTGIQLLHWGVVDQQWEKAVIELGNQPAKVQDYAKEFNNVTSLKASIKNRFYGYNGIDGGILTIWRNPAVQNNDITGVFYSNNYQPLRAYSLKYQGNDGFHPTAD